MNPTLQLTRMPGSSIAAPSAAAWVTDFLNAAFYARGRAVRDAADLRLAAGVLTTAWQRAGRRLGARDLPSFARAYHRDRLAAGGTLDHAALLRGAVRLLGPWFPEAWADPERRRHGIAFETVAEAQRWVPAARMQDAALAPLTPPEAPEALRTVSAYPRVALPDAPRALALLADAARWPDLGCAGGRFTALRPGGLEHQTFEIELSLVPVPRAPVTTRGYVTATSVRLAGDPDLPRSIDALARRAGRPIAPDDSPPIAHLELTTHAGHPLGRATSHLVLGASPDGTGWICDVGDWDPLPLPLAAAYRGGGAAAQHAFWGREDPEASMLVQLALATA